MDIGQILIKTLTDKNIISAISSSVFIILLGFYMRKKNILNAQAAKVLSGVILSAALPALAFTAFMQNINTNSLKQGANLLIWGIVIYIILIVVTKPLFMKYKGDKQDVLRVLTIFGSTTFFGIPIIGVVYGPEGVMYASIFNIGYRIFLYSYGYIKMSGLKMEKKNIKTMFLNPIVIATFAGLFIWVCQTYLPQVAVTVNGKVSHFAFLRIDQTAPWLFKPMDYLAKLASPLAWISIGATLAEISLKDAIKTKDAWYYSLNKIIIVPVINIALLMILNATGILPISQVAVATVVIMMATPTATVAAAYAISFDKEAILTSNCSLLSTILGVVAMPLWIVILEVIKSFHIFS
ncbi:malate permease [Bacillus pseudomycoides]|uniref:Malate permease n=1 Tax=Bacillus pseudomycoides TaxID=64104 RepID=A0AA91VAH7_9BACI|nr:MULTISPECIES: AEC family transporter [Bacillus]PEB52166.1 malate permease [Bacillus sp. AFS098217]PED81449.1 malate permease [Bacillus pseudomycoides]PEU11443.1 malate permease [Bacillus sp. AFS019443]PEU21609.1 malate permease [Bacillus sp. AFS014408]PFW58580.1 malate permease [Bacillus sp. AFS075034]